MQKIALFLVTLCISVSLLAQRPCSQPVYRQLDFWIGDWDLFGKDGKKMGDTRITLILDSCTIFEEWVGYEIAHGKQMAGKSFNMYNAATGQWQQTWVDNNGGTIEFLKGRYENNSMIFQSIPFALSKDTMAIRRLTYAKVDTDKVRQVGEISKDNGKTWTNEYEGEYRRKKK